jgi:hypothetical protein
MAGDEGRFGRLGEVRSCWCPEGIRPTVAKQQARQYVYAYAAVAPALGQMTCLILPYVNTQMMNLFLQQVSREFADYFIIMQVDKAAWHRSSCLKFFCLILINKLDLLTEPKFYPCLTTGFDSIPLWRAPCWRLSFLSEA